MRGESCTFSQPKWVINKTEEFLGGLKAETGNPALVSLGTRSK